MLKKQEKRNIEILRCRILGPIRLRFGPYKTPISRRNRKISFERNCLSIRISENVVRHVRTNCMGKSWEIIGHHLKIVRNHNNICRSLFFFAFFVNHCYYY